MPSLSVIRIPFQGTCSRSSRLTWSQQAMWGCIEWLGEDNHYFNLGTRLRVPSTCTRDDVTTAVASLIERHEVLRTRFVERDGEPRQEVSAEGAMTMRVFDLDELAQPGDSMPENCAEFILATLRSVPFDTASEWPLRCALVTVQGTPRYLVFIFSHLATDGSGVEACVRHVGQALTDGPRAAAAKPNLPQAWQAVDQALLESSPSGERASARAVRHWQAQLAKVPVPLFPECRQPASEPRVWRIAFVSRATAAGALMLARRKRTSPATIMLAATAAMFGAFTGNSVAALILTAGNRVDEPSRSCVAMMAQDTLTTISLDGADFPEIVERASSASTQAYFAGHYDPALIRQVRAGSAQERGIAKIDTSAYFNDQPPGPYWAQTVPQGLTMSELTALQADSKPITVSSWPRQDSKLFIHSFYMPGASNLHAVIDTAVFPLARARAFLCAMEELIVRAAFENVGPGEIGAIARQQEKLQQAHPCPPGAAPAAI